MTISKKRSEEIAKYVATEMGEGTPQNVAILHAGDRFRLKITTIHRYLEAAKLGVSTGGMDEGDLRARIRELTTALSGAQTDKLEATKVREYVFGLAAHDPAPPEWAVEPWRHDTAPGEPVLVLSDLHWGETVYPEQVFGVNEFNLAIARQRLQYGVEKAVWLAKSCLTGGGTYRGLTLLLGGDMLSGTIHDDIKMSEEVRIMPQVLDCVDNLTAAIEYLIAEFGEVRVLGVPGNHSRMSTKPYSKFYAETNFDWLIYQILERTFADRSTISFNCPPARDITFTVAEHRFRLTHGDQFRGGDGQIGSIGPVTRGNKKKMAAAMSLPGQPEMYDTMVVGHFHQYLARPNLIMNGSLKGYDEYGMSNNFEFEPPIQALFLVHPRWGINYSIPVICDPGHGK
jgi:hypothetical protein